jgi:C-terminal processing protease CtpA/Prc
LLKGKVKGLAPSLSAILRSLLPAILLGSGLFAQSGPTLSKTDREVVSMMLHQIDDDLRRYYYDPAFHGVDLKASVRDAELRLKTTTAFNEAIATLADLLIQLDDSHTTLMPPNRRVRVDYGWQMAAVGDVPLVMTVEPDSDAAAKGLAPGDRVLMLNSFEPRRANLWRLEYFYRFIRPQAQQRVAVLKPNGAAITVDVQSRVESRPMTELEDLLIEIEGLWRRMRDVSAAVGGDTLVWRMPVFGAADRVDEMIKQARPYKTLVLDLRGNGGGAVTALRELVSRCFDREVLVATVSQRGKVDKEIAKPSRGGFGGRLIVLVDSRSASAAEMFARIVQLEKRGTVLGDRTAGAVMTSRIIPHKAGLLGVFYATSITIGDVRMSDGGSLEKAGVEPDELLLPTPLDLASGRDPVLSHALELAGASVTPEEAGRLFK